MPDKKEFALISNPDFSVIVSALSHDVLNESMNIQTVLTVLQQSMGRAAEAVKR